MLKRLIRTRDAPLDYNQLIKDVIGLAVMPAKTSFTSWSCVYENGNNLFFVKGLNSSKIGRLYEGDYATLWQNYFAMVSSTIPSIPILALLELESGEYLEISELVNANIPARLHSLSWQQVKTCFLGALSSINALRINWHAHQEGYVSVGIDTAFWNFALDGRLMDFHPPRLLDASGNPIVFSRHHDIDHHQRMIYRTLSVEGMQLNLLATLVMKILESKAAQGRMPSHWVDILCELLLEHIQSTEGEQRSKDIQLLLQQDNPKSNFKKHPATILRELRCTHGI